MSTPQTILITGASSGIGKASALYFLEKGWQVIATMRQPEQVQDLPEHQHLLKVRLDVQDSPSISAAIEAGIAAFGKIDVLLNNAGYGSAGPLEAATEAQARRQFEVNFFGLIEVIRGVLPHFRARHAGLIINISSIGGLITLPLFSLYHASKWAVEGLTESLQYELNPLGIQLKIVEPGGVKTDFAGRSLDMFDASAFPDYQPTLQKLMQHFSPENERRQNYSTPESTAAVIYQAATDGSDQFRYLAGADAEQLWGLRQQLPYEQFREAVRKEMLG